MTVEDIQKLIELQGHIATTVNVELAEIDKQVTFHIGEAKALSERAANLATSVNTLGAHIDEMVRSLQARVSAQQSVPDPNLALS